MKALLAALLLGGQAVPPEAIVNGRATSYFIDNETLPRITCTNPAPDLSVWVGTGVWVGPDRLVTANHVVDKRGSCWADGAPIQFVRADRQVDYAEMRGRNFVGVVVPYSCTPIIRRGETYFAAGYSESAVKIKVQTIIALGERSLAPGYEMHERFRGSMWGGASGGGIFDQRGILVGIVTAIYATDTVAYEVFGLLLADTPLCRGNG